MQQEEIVLSINLDAERVATDLANATKALAEHKQQQKELKKAIEESNGTNAIAAKMYAEVSQQVEKETRQVKANTAILQANTKTVIDENMSLNEQRQALNAAQKAYAALSGEQKKSADAAGGLRDQIKALSDRVKEQEAAMGDNRRNVGNYADSILQASQQMGGFGKGLSGVTMGIKNATGAMKVMAATPLIAILNILVTIILKLSEKLRGNAAAMESLTRAFGTFEGIGVIVDKLIDKIAQGVVWLADKLYELAQSFGLLSSEMQASQEIAQEELELQKQQREAAEKTAEAELEIAKLRAQANEKDKYTLKQREQMLQQAADKEEEIFQTRYDLAKREYELQKKRNAQSESSQEDLRKESELKIAMINAETTLYNKRKELNRQMAQLRQKDAASVENAANAETKAEDAAQKKITEIRRKAEDLRAQLIEDEDARRLEQRRIAGTREIEQLKEQLATDKDLTAAAKDELARLIADKENAMNAELLKMAEDAAKKKLEADAAAMMTSQKNLLELRKQTLKKGSEETLQLSLQLLDIQHQEELAKYAENSQERLLIDEQYERTKAEMEQQYRDAKMQADMSMTQQIAAQATQLMSAISDAENASLQRYKSEQNEKKKALDKRLKAGEISEEQYNEQVQALDEQTAAKEKELAIEQAKRDKAIGILNAAVNTAAAIMKIWAEVPKVDFGASTIALTALAAAIGAAQIAAIAAQPLPTAARGVLVEKSEAAHGKLLHGASHTHGGVKIEAEGGEAIINKRATAKYLPILSAINQSTGGVPLFANGGIAGNFASLAEQTGMDSQYESMAAAMQQAVAALPSPVLDYAEFTDFKDNVAQYNELTRI